MKLKILIGTKENKYTHVSSDLCSFEVFSIKHTVLAIAQGKHDIFSNAKSCAQKDGGYAWRVDEYLLMMIMIIKNKW